MQSIDSLDRTATVSVNPEKDRLYRIIFQADTPSGKAFDVALLVGIIASILIVILESVPEIRARCGAALDVIEWGFTAVFTVEYAMRLYCVRRRMGYALSFFGIVDLLAIMPTYLALFIDGAETLLVIRVLRMLRVFRVFKLARYLGEANVLKTALLASGPKITVFLATVVSIVVILGAAMYLLETGTVGFESIPASMYWAVVTMTTVGYGDIVPHTPAGRFLAAILMIMGYAIIAVPTGIVSAELVQQARPTTHPRVCPQCMVQNHAPSARFCNACGAKL